MSKDQWLEAREALIQQKLNENPDLLPEEAEEQVDADPDAIDAEVAAQYSNFFDGMKDRMEAPFLQIQERDRT